MPRTLLALHGFGGFGADFDLVRPRSECWLAPDLPGAPLGDVLNGLDRLAGSQSVVLAGYSMGARVALAWVLRRPKQVAGLVLIGATAGIEDPTERAARRTEDERLASRAAAIGAEAFDEQWRQHPLIATQAPRIPDDAFRRRMLERRRRQPADRLRGHLLHLGQGAFTPLWDRLPRITCPTLLVAGADDTKYRLLATRMADCIPSADILEVPAGHAPHLESPAALRLGLNDWLATRL